MMIINILRQARHQIQRRPVAFLLLFLLIMGATFYPSRLDQARLGVEEQKISTSVHLTENVVRHVNWVLPLALAIAVRDINGLKQIAILTVMTTAATHIPKRLLNDFEVMGVRLGQRPSSVHSRHNMPSGHSALASAGAFFMARRYSLWLAFIGVPILFLTMHARVVLDAHTLSATIAGAAIGVLMGALFCTKVTGEERRRSKRIFGVGR